MFFQGNVCNVNIGIMRGMWDVDTIQNLASFESSANAIGISDALQSIFFIGPLNFFLVFPLHYYDNYDISQFQ